MTDVLLDSGSLYAGGMTILHSFWQATLLATVLWAVSRYANLNAPRRYALGYGLLLTQVLLSVLTCLYYYEPAPTSVVALPADYLIVGSQGPAADGPAPWTDLSFWLPGLVAAWAAGLLIGSVRLTWSYGRVRMIAAASRAVLPGGEHDQLYRRTRELADRIGYAGQLRIGITDRISGPLLVGHLKPILLFPVALVNHLSTEEAETVILHELAHLRRYDHLLNPLQCVIEVLFYYHPAIHWIGARVREERENCCDDLVLHYGPGRLAYARALLYFSEQAATPAPGALALADGGGLVARLRRLINNQEKFYTMNPRLLLLPVLALLTLAASAAYAPDESGTELTGLFPTDPAPATTPTALDTLPQGSHQVTKISDGKTTRLRVEDGKIKELELEGQTVPESEYPLYEGVAEELLGLPRPVELFVEDTVFVGSRRDTLAIYRVGEMSDFLKGQPIRMPDGSFSLKVIEEALSTIQEINFDELQANLDNVMIDMDSISNRFSYFFQLDAEDGDRSFDLRRFDYDSLAVDDIGIRILRSRTQKIQNLEQLEAQQRALREALHELERRQREIERLDSLERERPRGTGSIFLNDPIGPEKELDRFIPHRKAVQYAIPYPHHYPYLSGLGTSV